MTKALNNIGQLCPVSSHQCVYKLKTGTSFCTIIHYVRDNSIPGSFCQVRLWAILPIGPFSSAMKMHGIAAVLPLLLVHKSIAIMDCLQCRLAKTSDIGQKL